MSGDRIYKRKSSAAVIGGGTDERRVSLTAYNNIVIDTSGKTPGPDDDKPKVHVRFASLPSLGVAGLGGDTGYRRKYSVALQSLKPFRPSSKDGKLPINRVGMLSYVFSSWFTSLVFKMFRHRNEAVSESDIWECSDQEGLEVNTTRMLRLWKDEVAARGEEKASFERVWWRFMKTRLLVQLFLITILAISTFLSSAFLLEKLVSYLEAVESDMALGVGLVVGVAACEFTRACTFSSILVFGGQTGARVRSGFIGIMYDKLLKMRSIKGKVNAEIINVFSVDSYRVYMASTIIVFLFSVPLYLTIGLVYCYILIGPWSFLSVGTFVVCYQAQTFLARAITKLRRLCSGYTDKRVRRMGEVLNSIKFIKTYAWEVPFTEAIKIDRKSEQKYLLYSALVNAVTGSIIPITPTIASVVTITAYTAYGNQLTASTAFAVIGTMNFLRIIVALIPVTLRTYGESKVSFKRLKRLLLKEEFCPPSPLCRNHSNAVEMGNASFTWEFEDMDQVGLPGAERRRSSVASIASYGKKKSRGSRGSLGMFALTDLNIEIPKGRLVGICGAVGGGKSSIMSAIMGRMPMLDGHLAVDGTIAYVAQQAWIFNATVRENILFGREYEAKRYQEVISACGLETDFQLFADGDETEIGERGANLSGGQKQRVNLARAVYSNSDIYILDDPLSAVDVRVGKHLFHVCIKQVLAARTVLLVTHQLQYLKHCDEVLVVEDGMITQQGEHKVLLAQDGAYSDMFNIFNQTSMTASTTKPEHANDDSDQGTTGKVKTKDITTVPAVTKPQTANGSSIKKKSALKKKKGRLVLQEEATLGDITCDTYLSYMRAGGGITVSLSVILIYCLASGSVVFSDWWLSQWITALGVPSMVNTPLTDNNTWSNMDTSNATTFMSPTFNTSDSSRADVTTTPSNITLIPLGTTTPVTSFLDISLDMYLIVYISSLAGIIFLQLIKSFTGAKVSITASNRFHQRCLDKIFKAPMSFFDANPAGRILNRFSKDLDEADVFIPQMTNALLQIMTLVFLSTIMTALVTPWILLAVVPVIIVYYVMKLVSTVSIRQLKRLENIVRSPLLSHVNVTSQGLSTIVAYEQEDRFFETCKSLGGVSATAMLLFDVSMRWIGIRLDLASSMLTVVTALILVLSKGVIPPASAGLILSLCGKTVSIMPFLIRTINETEARFTSVERLREYAKTLPTEPQHANKMAPAEWPSEGALEFRNVVMRYRPEMDPVLKDISFSIRPREKIGVIGRTGAGKSSLAAVLFRLVELSSGQILIDGEDISQLHLKTVRSKISTIPQDPVLFAGTLRYNIDPFSQSSDDEIWDALEKVHMKEKVVEVEEGLEFEVEENGENFSVGERQLVCLSRAVLRKSKILLLDEATANIDTSTDAMIQETIRTCFPECTVITIAHRLNTVLHSDRILVMDAGEVMECASPQNLLSNPNSFFNAMIAAQSVKTPSP